MASGYSRPTSVRGLYGESPACRVQVSLDTAPPAEEWVFLPPTVSPPPLTSPPTPSHLPTPFTDSDTTVITFAPTVYSPLQLFAAEYFTTALGMPFEVGKTLLQVEYRPRKKFAPVVEESKVEGGREWGAEEDEVRRISLQSGSAC